MNDTDDKGEVLGISVPEYGKRWGLGRAASYRAAKRGEIPTVRIGGRLIVPLKSADRKLEEAAIGKEATNG